MSDLREKPGSEAPRPDRTSPCSDANPENCKNVLHDGTQRRHAQAKPVIPLSFSPQYELDEQVLHNSVGSLRLVAHEVDRDLLLPGSLPDIGKSHDPAFSPDGRRGKLLDVLFFEKPQGKSFLLRFLLDQPGIGNSPATVYYPERKRKGQVYFLDIVSAK
ncbi:MAG: hypothetical protein A3G93_01540 [Nitrospinae bacterium RIFCSPLOWO2_12_FULL_45_22]|nr:MAG: hypothetical protein A3G93_01540 [Nitrospinae bacterium RIFCSPLOWO2_12_FULL_45_22]